MNLYRMAYRIIGLFVGAEGLLLVPFLDVLTKGNENIENLTAIYMLYLMNTVMFYFFAYKRSFFSADQKERVLHMTKLVF